jgi:hypothetical protein
MQQSQNSIQESAIKEVNDSSAVGKSIMFGKNLNSSQANYSVMSKAPPTNRVPEYGSMVSKSLLIGPVPKNFHRLYDQGMDSHFERLRVAEEAQLKKGENELEDCSFHPAVPLQHKPTASLSFVERQQLWTEIKNERLDKLVEEKIDSEERMYTFNPNITQSRASKAIPNTYEKQLLWLEEVEKNKLDAYNQLHSTDGKLPLLKSSQASIKDTCSKQPNLALTFFASQDRPAVNLTSATNLDSFKALDDPKISDLTNNRLTTMKSEELMTPADLRTDLEETIKIFKNLERIITTNDTMLHLAKVKSN